VNGTSSMAVGNSFGNLFKVMIGLSLCKLLFLFQDSMQFWTFNIFHNNDDLHRGLREAVEDSNNLGMMEIFEVFHFLEGHVHFFHCLPFSWFYHLQGNMLACDDISSQFDFCKAAFSQGFEDFVLPEVTL
jgi:hypothetical protein